MLGILLAPIAPQHLCLPPWNCWHTLFCSAGREGSTPPLVTDPSTGKFLRYYLARQSTGAHVSIG